MNITNKDLIYDEDCPLCAAYTAAFVKTGLLSANGRKNFNSIEPGIFNLVDKTKCNNEIPLVDTQTKQVWYGVDALLELLDRRIPFTKKLGNVPPIKWLLLQLYKFISYNRKVIVAATPKEGYDSSPDFNVQYRLFFLAVFFIFNSWMLHPLHTMLLSQSFMSKSSFSQFQFAHLAFVTVNVSTALLIGRKKGLEYLGQVNMLALITMLLITPLLIVIHITGWQNRDLHHFYLGMVTVLVFLEYARRMKYASIIQQFPIVVFINFVCLAAFIIYLAY